jgi:hypothetical protein
MQGVSIKLRGPLIFEFSACGEELVSLIDRFLPALFLNVDIEVS